jgi:methionyl-tRNA formyltransferase
MKNKIKTIFIGTPDFAVPSLCALINDEQFDIISVITQPDKKAGRKQVITPPPVKVIAEKHNIPVLQPPQITNYQLPASRCGQGGQITNLKPDLIIVIAYAQIMPEDILNIPKYGVINVHGSLLPKYRGASCIQAAILSGDKETGVTLMRMDKGLDTGPILAQKSINILPADTAGSLYKKLSELGAQILTPTLKKYINKEIKPKPQDNKKASHVGLLKKQDGKISWSKSAVEIEKFVRAMNPWPVAWTKLGSKNLKILEAGHESLKINRYKTGELLLDNSNLLVQCGQDALVIKRLQLEGKTEVSDAEFIRGHKNLIGSILL